MHCPAAPLSSACAQEFKASPDAGRLKEDIQPIVTSLQELVAAGERHYAGKGLCQLGLVAALCKQCVSPANCWHRTVE